MTVRVCQTPATRLDCRRFLVHFDDLQIIRMIASALYTISEELYQASHLYQVRVYTRINNHACFGGCLPGQFNCPQGQA